MCADLDSGLRIVAQGQEPPSLRDLDLDSSALDLRALAMEREMADLELRSLREKLENCLPPGDGEDAEGAGGSLGGSMTALAINPPDYFGMVG